MHRPARRAPAVPSASRTRSSEGAPVVIAGFGAFGATVGRLLRANGVEATVLDLDSGPVDLLRRLGIAGATTATPRGSTCCTRRAPPTRGSSSSRSTRRRRRSSSCDTVRQHFPQLTILARAFDWQDAHELLAAGVTHVYREALDTSLRRRRSTRSGCSGFRAYQAHRAAQRFLRHDEQ